MDTSYIFLAPGFEETEAITVVDVMRRAGMDIKTVSITPNHSVTGAHGITLTADLIYDKTDFITPEWLIIPGGMPGAENIAPHAPYNRNETFDGKQLGRVWQWNHNPDDRMWSLRKGRLRLNTLPAEQLMWARNTLTQRVIGPKSTATVQLFTKGMKDGDVAGLGNINVPCSWTGIVKDGSKLTLRCFEQLTNDTIDTPITLKDGKIWLQLVGD